MVEFIKKVLLYSTFLILYFPVTILLYNLDETRDFEKMEVEDLVTKFRFLHKNKHIYNTAFVGSSTIYRHVNPAVIDSMCQTTSFNLGSGGFRPVRSFDMLEMIYDSDINLKYLFFELNRFETLKQNFNTTPSIRSLSWKYYTIIVGSVIRSEYTTFRKAQYIAVYTFTLVYKYFGTGVLGQLTQRSKPIELSDDRPILRNAGFYALTDYMLENNDPEAIERQQFLLKNQSLLSQISEMNTFTRPDNYRPPGIPYAEYMNDLYWRFRKKGTQLIFVLNPRNFDKNDVKFLNHVAYHLPPNSVIHLYDSRQYPEFYDYKLSFDLAHFTKEGANKYSVHLANEFKKIQLKANLRSARNATSETLED